ncbi:2-phosphosulfolactate phosphatase [Pseudogracilibacillus sp. SE30717A]|uniref:2-phosphosulfolactate phosphatase n=1 Tax=Pseudogracilibacillus sp. SE30717A TaxID=3098293 RepID=UPI00300E6AA8
MHIQIYQGSTIPTEPVYTTIVIDVIRAFTVAHYAFLKGIKQIYLAATVEQAFKIKFDHPDFLLAGEVEGLPIRGFDLDNSPYNISNKDIVGKTLIQKTTNGVEATLNCLSSDHILVTGYTNAKTTANFVKEKLLSNENNTIRLVASHPSGDDDLACAEYIKSMIDGTSMISNKEVIERIKKSHVAKKFFDKNNNFLQEDIDCCIRELDTDFVMKVNKEMEIPMIERIKIQ